MQRQWDKPHTHTHTQFITQYLPLYIQCTLILSHPFYWISCLKKAGVTHYTDSIPLMSHNPQLKNSRYGVPQPAAPLGCQKREKSSFGIHWFCKSFPRCSWASFSKNLFWRVARIQCFLLLKSTGSATISQACSEWLWARMPATWTSDQFQGFRILLRGLGCPSFIERKETDWAQHCLPCHLLISPHLS